MKFSSSGFFLRNFPLRAILFFVALSARRVIFLFSRHFPLRGKFHCGTFPLVGRFCFFTAFPSWAQPPPRKPPRPTSAPCHARPESRLAPPQHRVMLAPKARLISPQHRVKHRPENRAQPVLSWAQSPARKSGAATTNPLHYSIKKSPVT